MTPMAKQTAALKAGMKETRKTIDGMKSELSDVRKRIDALKAKMDAAGF